MDRSRWWIGIGLIGILLLLLDVHPCREGTGGCGQPLLSDGEQSCVPWMETYGQVDRHASISIDRVPIQSYLEELGSFGQRVPAPLLTALPQTPPPTTEAESAEHTKQAVLEYAQDAEEPVEVVLDLGALPFPGLGELATLDPEARDRVLAARKALIEQEQESLNVFLHDRGARTVKPVGLVNHLHAWIPPEAIPEVVARPDVKAIYPAWQSVDTLYDLEELREATFLSEYWELDVKGETASRICEPAQGYDDIKIAVIEPWIASFVFANGLDTSHPGWEDCEGCESRIRALVDCSPIGGDPDPCRSWSGVPAQVANHGTWVASIVAGDLTQGQDPSMRDLDQCRCRTGVAPESSLLYLTATSAGDIGAAIASAFLLGADVINLSVASTECSGNPLANCGGINQVIRAVTEAGTLVVAAAGNTNPQCAPGNDCTVCYPAFSPSVIAVGNVETPRGLDYDLADIAKSSSRGSLTVGVGGRYSTLFQNGVAIPVVSIAAPGNLCSYFSSESTYDETGNSGTSFAAPVVSAAAGLIREEFGPELRDARMLRSHILAMGDGTDAETPSPGVTVGMSSTWGAGRAKFHAFESMKSPKGMAHRSFRIHEDELAILTAADTKGKRFDPAVTQWKMGMYIDTPDLAAIPYVLVTYWDTCNGRKMIAADLHAGFDRHAILESPAVNQACLEVQVYGYSIPADGVDVFVTDYYHSGDPAQH